MENRACDGAEETTQFLTNVVESQFKIVLLGNTSVGKTALLNRLIHDVAPIEQRPDVTAGAEFRTKSFLLDQVIITLKICDCSGQERFTDVLKPYYANCDAVVIVYDISNEPSFLEAQRWVIEIRQMELKDQLIVLVGNKVDLNHKRVISFSEAKNFALDNNLIFRETSAVSAFNVEDCFQDLAKTLWSRKSPEDRRRFDRLDSIDQTSICFCPMRRRK